MWRTHADAMPDEAAALTVLALADLHAAAAQAVVPWTLLLDEFGAVIRPPRSVRSRSCSAAAATAARSIVITQSRADVEALTEQPGLLDSLTDNFAGVVAHRQTAPEAGTGWRG